MNDVANARAEQKARLEKVNYYRQMLVDFYQDRYQGHGDEKDSKLQQVNAIMLEYQGREHEIEEVIEQTIAQDAAPPLAPTGMNGDTRKAVLVRERTVHSSSTGGTSARAHGTSARAHGTQGGTSARESAQVVASLGDSPFATEPFGTHSALRVSHSRRWR
jgi:hypothetical protein